LSSLDLELLLESIDIRLVGNSSADADPSFRDETLLWEDSAGPLTIWRVGKSQTSYYRLRLGNEVTVDVLPQGLLTVSPAPRTPQVTVDHFLADQVFPRLLSQKDDLILHAAAVRKDNRALLLLGASGSGKSTLAASFGQCGWSLMGDDAIVLSATACGTTAHATYSSLRLFPDSIDALFSTDVVTYDMAHYSSKQRIEVTVGQLDRRPVPVKAMFLLGSEAHLSIRRLSVARACMAIIENSFALDPTDRDMARQRLERSSRLASSVPVYSLSYPRDFRRLPDVQAAIMSAVADEQPCPH
jgi:hypothetical protein